MIRADSLVRTPVHNGILHKNLERTLVGGPVFAHSENCVSTRAEIRFKQRDKLRTVPLKTAERIEISKTTASSAGERFCFSASRKSSTLVHSCPVGLVQNIRRRCGGRC